MVDCCQACPRKQALLLKEKQMGAVMIKKILAFILSAMLACPAPAMALTASDTWAKKWFAASEQDRFFLVMGYRLGVDFICGARDATSETFKILCLASDATTENYSMAPTFIDMIYKVKRYENIPIERALHVTLLVLSGRIQANKISEILDGLVTTGSSPSRPRENESIKRYEDMVRALLQ